MGENFVQNAFGYCFYEIKENSALIYNLFVHPKFRGTGKSKILLKHTINEIEWMGCTGKIFIEAKPKECSIDVKNLISYYEKMNLNLNFDEYEKTSS